MRSQGFVHPATLVPSELEYAEGYRARMSILWSKMRPISSGDASKQFQKTNHPQQQKPNQLKPQPKPTPPQQHKPQQHKPNQLKPAQTKESPKSKLIEKPKTEKQTKQ
jgi:fructose 1,6-bisphosphate aldolase/phosphatase